VGIREVERGIEVGRDERKRCLRVGWKGEKKVGVRKVWEYEGGTEGAGLTEGKSKVSAKDSSDATAGSRGEK